MKPHATQDSEKQQATRLVESYEGLGCELAVAQGPTVYGFLDGLESWSDTSPVSGLASPTTIRWWDGWDTHRSLLVRLQAARSKALIGCGRSATGLPVSTLAARQSVWDATVSGFSEGLDEGIRSVSEGRLFGSEFWTLNKVLLVGAAGLAVLATLSLARSASGLAKGVALA